MSEPAAVERRSSADRVRTLHPVPSRTREDAPAGQLAAELAAALRAVRGYVPHRIWWLTGAADALLAYRAVEEAPD